MSKNDQTISQRIARLDELVAWFEGDDFEIEKAFDKFELAEELATSIEQELSQYKNQINLLKQKFDQE